MGKRFDWKVITPASFAKQQWSFVASAKGGILCKNKIFFEQVVRLLYLLVVTRKRISLFV